MSTTTTAPFAIPLAKLQVQHLNKRLVAGIAIVANRQQQPELRKLLLLRRAPTEDVYPEMYELPGGGAEAEDETILATAARETREETGLGISNILGAFGGFEYATRKSQAIQFNFLAEVEHGLEASVVLNPSEHDTYAWVGVADNMIMSKYPMPESMSKVVADALNILRSPGIGDD
ncbi:unnamed protein product [Cyclocybe aegerita]|uniref:Nudix hydrolase domain-containing protein n=1 Tax=Cyclocybe aegerita TaxID=1973307 RepID=A0A8S0XDX1_CYCAE|nr:unnamed protein product [Cyclocybe aegerita]